jgi:hypothetical protein
MTQQTDDITKPDVEIPTDNDDSEGSDQMQEGQEFTEGLGGENQDGTADNDQQSDAEKLADAIEQIAQAVDIAVSTLDNKIELEGVIYMFSKEKDTPCRICMAIRIFLLSVLTIALLTFIDRSILSAVASLKPLTIALILVGVLAFFALLKSAFEYRQWKKRD